MFPGNKGGVQRRRVVKIKIILDACDWSFMFLVNCWGMQPGLQSSNPRQFLTFADRKLFSPCHASLAIGVHERLLILTDGACRFDGVEQSCVLRAGAVKVFYERRYALTMCLLDNAISTVQWIAQSGQV